MNSEKGTQVILADSRYLVLEALQAIIACQTNLLLSGMARSQKELLIQLEKAKNGLLIVDPVNLNLGCQELQKIKNQFPGFAWLVLTEILTKSEFDDLIRCGLKNILYKNAEKEEFLVAIKNSLIGKKYFSEEVLDLALESDEKKSQAVASVSLTSVETDIVRLIASGLTTKEIASRRNVSHHTVNTHRKNIFRKMEVSNSSELIMNAIKAGWIDNIEYFI